jgi:hypothetical protein
VWPTTAVEFAELLLTTIQVLGHLAASTMATELWRAKVIAGYEATRADEVTLKVFN